MNRVFPFLKRRQWPPARSVCAVATLSLAILAGCAVGPNYQRPVVSSPDNYRGQSDASTNSLGDLPWRNVFQDTALQQLIAQALTNNYDLRIAFSRVEQARQLAAQARSGFFPQVNYAASAGAGRNIGAGNTPSPTGQSGQVFGGDFTASWDLDLWGRVRRLNEAARAQYFASNEGRRDIQCAIIAQAAQGYYQLLALDRDLAIARETTNSFAESRKLFGMRLEGGVASKLETSSAEALYKSTAAAIPQLEQRIALQENVLSVLLGSSPGGIERGGSALDAVLTSDVPAGLPSSLLERRPDIRQAEQLLHAANAQVGVAKANFFPHLTLTGLLGRVSPEVSGLTYGGANAWGAAASLAGPIFQGGALRAQYREALAARDQAALQYQATVLNALQEVSSSLIAREKLEAARSEQALAVDAYKEAVKVSMERYHLGRSSYYEVLQEQQLLFPAENALVEIQLNRLLANVQLYRALGGGWRDTKN